MSGCANFAINEVSQWPLVSLGAIAPARFLIKAATFTSGNRFEVFLLVLI
jgi:hypothetical protein